MAVRAPATERHPWLSRFTAAPEDEFGKLLMGHADIFPYDRADSPDAARSLFGPLAEDDPARAALGSAIIAWLERRRKEHFPAERSALLRRLREICEAFEIVAYVNVTDAAVALRRHFPLWNEWVAPLGLSAARDARAAYWRMLALTQPQVRAAVPLDMAPFWLSLCRKAGESLPSRYLDIGLLGLRRLPEEYAWLAGLAQWAMARQPSPEQFRAEWLALKPLYPKAPKRWRELVGTLLASELYREADIEAPAWWSSDPDFAPLAKDRDAHKPIRSPMPEECQAVIDRFDLPFTQVRQKIDALMTRHQHFARLTGESRYVVRAIHSLGSALIRREGDGFVEGCLLAADLAREGLEWRPFDPFLWSLWQDALAISGAREAAETVGWEQIRRLPENLHAYSQLAEMLIAFDRIDAAEEVMEAAFLRGLTSPIFYALRARLRDHRGDHTGAMDAVWEGLGKYPSASHLVEYARILKRSEPLRVRSVEWEQRLLKAAVVEPANRGVVMCYGKMRRLRAELEGGDQDRRQRALTEVRAVLAEEPTFAYARLLAIREGDDSGETGSLEPPFAIAFECALAAEDRERLEALAKQHPRLEALVLVVLSLLGDAEPLARMAEFLRAVAPVGEERAVTILRAGLQPFLVAIDGGGAAEAALDDRRTLVVAVLRDAVDITLAGERLAA